jgi:type 1 fimbria pilin
MNRAQKMTLFAGLMTVLLVLGGLSQVYTQAKTVTVKGEVIDTYCYATMGAKGESHRECAIDCFKAGIPAGLLENGTNKVFVLLPNKDKTSLPQKDILEKMGRQATIVGKVYTSGGSNFLTIESIK